MEDIELFLDLDMNIKIRKALASITSFIRSRTEREGTEELERAIAHLQGIHQALLDRARIRGR